MQGISVVICCYNSELRISETLRHIAMQKVSSDVSWEIIIINNNSTDDTKNKASIEWSKYNSDVPFCIIDEISLGLSAARARGFESAKYENIIFCDDDNWLNENYIQLAYQTMNGNPEIGALGGDIEAVCEQSPPKWFHKFEYAYAVGKQGKKEGDISNRYFIWGAGLVIRKKIWITMCQSGFVSLISDRKGSKLSAGGDSELCLMALLLGYKLWYNPRLTLKHYIPKNRLSWNYLKGLFKGFGASDPSILSLKYLLLIQGSRYNSGFRISWKKEAWKIIVLFFRHPKRLILGLTNFEGFSEVTWFLHYSNCFLQLLKLRGKLDKVFNNNCEILK